MVFQDPILAGATLVRDGIQSEGYVAGSTGWRINRDGTAEFNTGTFRGSVVVNNAGGTAAVTIDANGVKTVGTDGSAVQMTTGGGATLALTPPIVAGVTFFNAFIVGGEDGTAEHRGVLRIVSPEPRAGVRPELTMTSAGTTQNATNARLRADTVVFTDNADANGVMVVGGNNGRVSVHTNGVEETWHNAALLNGWTLSGSNVMRYRRVASPPNEGELRGVITSPNPFNQIMFNVPAPYRPVATQAVWAWTSEGSGQLVQIQPNGNVVGFGSTTVGRDWWIAGTYPLD